ncbi:hypothetical protein PoB_000321900 [Plakobranchus ocellatus]|uniref:Uncharacterized protein n=1 Tax=Plakobranchus ocellatus TaxID=259542 RepID=A0AAV3Y3B5_9GAST|nr:hypothetical protein PoB_000321900 [Plakobranchus ocellatus]
MFSPEYLEQMFPVQRSEQIEPKKNEKRRNSGARRLSLRMKLLQAFSDLEHYLEHSDGDVNVALEEYYTEISEKITKYTKERQMGQARKSDDTEATSETGSCI